MKVYPVVHMKSPEHAIDLSQQAMEDGADGVFVIDHLTPQNPDVLTRAYEAVRSSLSEMAFIGVNYLGLRPEQSVRHLANFHETREKPLPDALWADNAIVKAGGVNILELKERLGIEQVKYFGGIAFKYTDYYTDDPEKAAALARQYAQDVDVVTTSGPGTGSAASADKLTAMKQAIGSKPLALASGVSAENIAEYASTVDAVLAASSVETYSYSGVFIRSKLRDLIQRAHEL